MTRVQAALNGGREHPAPLTPDEVAAEASAAIEAGAFAAHVHPRDANGRESIAGADVAAVVNAAAEIGVTTGAWIGGDRIAHIRRWTTLPAFASVNMHEEQAIEIAELLLSRGIAVEAGLADAKGARVFMTSGLWRRCLRILIEPQEQSLADALANVERIEAVIRDCRLPRVLHGVDATAWPLVEEAARRSIDTRIGFEDTMRMPDGSGARSNAELVTAALAQIAKAARSRLP